MGWWTFLKEAAEDVAKPAAGKVALFVDSGTGIPSFKDEGGSTHSLKGADGDSVHLAGSELTYADLPTTLTSADAGSAYIVEADNLMYVWSGTAFPADGAGVAINGRTILNGSGVPDNALGHDGDYYLDNDTSELWGPKADGAWPAAGVSLVGPAGADGLTVLSGAGGPAADLGVDGDFYIDTAAHLIYGPKAAGAWGAETSLIGPKGDKGDTGAAGNLIIGLNAQGGTVYTLALTDANKNVRLTNGGAIQVTVPAAADVPWPANTVIYLSQGGAGVVSIVGAAGVTVNNDGALTTAGVGTYLALVNVGADVWDVV